jgi:flagellar biosynthesis chaperone FliJ
MKKLYDIRINPKKPTTETVDKYKDFDALLKQFETAEERPKVVQMRRQSPYKRWALVAASLTTLVFVTYAIQQNFFGKNTVEQVAQPFINPPLKTLKTEFAELEIDVQTGGEFTMADGTKIFIPKDAFVDAKGALIFGTVVLQYRKYQDIADIFLSGIPMQYDSANIRYDMASVGMMELYGTTNGSMARIHPNKNLSVQLVAQTDLNRIKDYNVYQLDTLAKNWTYVALDDVTIQLDAATNKRIDAALKESEIVKNIALIHHQLYNLEGEKVKEVQQIAAKLSAPMPLKPTKPNTPNPNNFVLDFDLSDFMQDADFASGGRFYDSTMYNANEHLTKYQDVMWEVSADQKRNYDLAISNIVWDKVKLDKVDNQQFRLKLSNGSKAVQLVIRPILKGRDLKNAQSEYERQLTAYEVALEKYNTTVAPEMKGLDEKYASKLVALENEIVVLQRSYNKARIEVMRSMDLELENQTIVNRFKVKQFGIWNCDKPEVAEKRTVTAKFQDENGKSVDYYMVYVADKNNGRVQRFYTNQKTEITYNPDSENVMWLVSKDGKIAVAKAAEFNKIGNKKRFTFTLNKITQQIDNKEDVKRILGL